MWYTWTTLLLVSCALVKADGEARTEAPVPAPVATTRLPPHTLDRHAAELAWKSWLQSPESGNQNAPPRRITTKSLFITPLVCPKGQRLDRNGCIQVVTVNKDEHERILLEQLTALFTTPPNGGNPDVVYDYGEDEPGPMQLTIPIGLDPQASPLHGQEPSAQAQDLQPSYVKVNKKDGNKSDGDASIEAELELLKLQTNLNENDTAASNILNQNVLTNILNYPEKPKRDSPTTNVTEKESNTTDVEQNDVGQKELVYGHVNIDPIIYNTESPTDFAETESTEDESNNSTDSHGMATTNKESNENQNTSTKLPAEQTSDNRNEQISKSTVQQLMTTGPPNKLSPENDYSDIGEAIKLISRYADVTTDDNFAKQQNKYEPKEDSILGTRTKLQYRRNKPKEQPMHSPPVHLPLELVYNDKTPTHEVYPSKVYYRYPWTSQHSPTPPPNYPFRHLQDYWPGRNQVGGVYNTHENPRRHHHSYPHNFRLHSYPHSGFERPSAYPDQLKGYIRRVVQHHGNPIRANANNQDLYSLLGLRHWFSSEGTSKR